MRTWTKMKVVHLFPNEPKFFRGAVSFFAPLEWSEKWLIRCKNEELDVFQSMAAETNIQRFSSAFQLDASQDGVIVHYLDLEMAEWILKIPKDIPVYIQTWGGDTAPLLDSKWLYGPKTRGFYYEKSALSAVPMAAGYPVYERRRKSRDRDWHIALQNAMRRAEYTSFLLGSTERNAIAPDLKVEDEFRITYANDMVASPLQPGLPDHILLGNSATPTNQHWEALLALKESNFEMTSILMPLSYGDEEYANWISSKARTLFGPIVTCLRDFLPLEEYQQHIGRCGMVVMNHSRQQALGNIYWALNSGKRVTLNAQGINYRHLVKQGVMCEPLNATQLNRTPPDSIAIRESVRVPFQEEFGNSTERKKAFFKALFN